MPQLMIEPRTSVSTDFDTRTDIIETRAAADRLLHEMSELLLDADREALRNGGEIPPATRRVIMNSVQQAITSLNDLIGDDVDIPEDEKAEIGRNVFSAWRPYLMLTEAANRFYTKPLGYAGDYETIRLIYRNQGGGIGSLGPVIDQAILETDACQSCRNRRPLLAAKIQDQLNDHPGQPVQITSLGSGPAEELFDVLGPSTDARERLTAHCVDIDFSALAHVIGRAKSENLGRQIRGHQANLFRVAAGKESVPIGPQDFVYSVGLIDYFEDAHVIQLMDWMHSILRPGGTALLGNLHVSNAVKAFADHVLDWKLIHRTESDMHRLFRASRFGRGCTRIEFEAAGVNMFATCTKEANR